jgi:ribonuclease HII
VGVDEAGRGAIAGPLVVASFLDCFSYPTYIKDSKKIKEEKREEIFDIFLEKKYIFGIGIVSNLYIDKCGILNAFKEGIYLSLNFICGKKSNLFDENFFEYYDFRKNYSLYYSELNRSEENFLILVDGNFPVIKNIKLLL